MDINNVLFNIIGGRKMIFSANRIFRSEIISFKGLHDINDVIKLFEPNTYILEKSLETKKPIVIQQAYYLSGDICTFSSELQNARDPKTDMFKYDIYLFFTKINNFPIAIISVPFIKLAAKLFPKLHNSGQGLELIYHKVDIKKYLKNIKSGHHLGGKIKTTKIDSQIITYPNISKISLIGSDVPESKLYDELLLDFSSNNIKTYPTRCEVLYYDVLSEQFKIDVDKHGNYSFYVKSKAFNLPNIYNILLYFFNENIMDTVYDLPIKYWGFYDEKEANNE